VYALNGYVHYDDLYLVPILLVVSIAGTWTGKQLLRHVSQQQFKYFTLILILATGLVTLYKFLMK
jgi:uncharacterized protein